MLVGSKCMAVFTGGTSVSYNGYRLVVPVFKELITLAFSCFCHSHFSGCWTKKKTVGPYKVHTSKKFTFIFWWCALNIALLFSFWSIILLEAIVAPQY